MKASKEEFLKLQDDFRHVVTERDRLQRIIDSRPAINAGLPGTYIEWSQSIYAMDVVRAVETAQ